MSPEEGGLRFLPSAQIREAEKGVRLTRDVHRLSGTKNYGME